MSIDNTTDVVKQRPLFSRYDTGVCSEVTIDREANFRIGWLLEAMCAVAVGNKSSSVRRFLELIKRRVDACQKARSDASWLAEKNARKRLKRNEYRLTFTEQENERARFVRGCHQSAATTEQGIRELVKSKLITNIDSLREVLVIWEFASWEWALCADHEAHSPGICPPFISEVLYPEGGAV